MINFAVGDTVKIKTSHTFPLGGWLHGETAVVVAVYELTEMLTVELKNEVLRKAITQDISKPGLIKTSFGNVQLLN